MKTKNNMIFNNVKFFKLIALKRLLNNIFGYNNIFISRLLYRFFTFNWRVKLMLEVYASTEELHPEIMWDGYIPDGPIIAPKD